MRLPKVKVVHSICAFSMSNSTQFYVKTQKHTKKCVEGILTFKKTHSPVVIMSSAAYGNNGFDPILKLNLKQILQSLVRESALTLTQLKPLKKKRKYVFGLFSVEVSQLLF